MRKNDRSAGRSVQAKGKGKVVEGVQSSHMDADATPSTPVAENVVSMVAFTPHIQNIAELEEQLAQLKLHQMAQDQVVGTMNASRQELAHNLPTFAANVQATAQAAVTQLGAQVGKAQVTFADRQMQVMTQLQAQCTQNAAEMHQLKATLAQTVAPVPKSGTACAASVNVPGLS